MTKEKVEILGSLLFKGPPHLAPGGANLPVATEVQLTRLGDVGPGEMSTTLWRYGGATTSEFLSAEQLAVLGARATGSAAGCPLASLPAVGEGEGKDGWRRVGVTDWDPHRRRVIFHTWHLHF